MFWLIASLACSEPAPTTSSPAKPTALNARSDIDVDQFAALVQKGGIDVLDVRTPEEFASGHVPGAKNLPIDDIDLVNPLLSSHDKGKPLYVICAQGGRSSRASDQLASAGFQTVNVLGGTNAYRDKGLPLE
jgi:rhodanese-related sulfurtransferase